MSGTPKCTIRVSGDMHVMLLFVVKPKKNVKGEKRLSPMDKIKHNPKIHLRRPTKAKMKEVFCNRNPLVPSVIRFHPYDPWLAVADKDGCT